MKECIFSKISNSSILWMCHGMVGKIIIEEVFKKEKKKNIRLNLFLGEPHLPPALSSTMALSSLLLFYANLHSSKYQNNLLDDYSMP